MCKFTVTYTSAQIYVSIFVQEWGQTTYQMSCWNGCWKIEKKPCMWILLLEGILHYSQVTIEIVFVLNGKIIKIWCFDILQTVIIIASGQCIDNKTERRQAASANKLNEKWVIWVKLTGRNQSLVEETRVFVSEPGMGVR